MDKCIINVLVQDVANKKHDDIIFLLGEKYEGRWWFYNGPDMVIIQENYIKDTAVYALPFSTLREIALKNTLSWYYIEKPAGTCLKKLFSVKDMRATKNANEEKYIINDEYFEYEINVGMNPSPKKRIEWYLNVFLKKQIRAKTLLELIQ